MAAVSKADSARIGKRTPNTPEPIDDVLPTDTGCADELDGDGVDDDGLLDGVTAGPEIDGVGWLGVLTGCDVGVLVGGFAGRLQDAFGAARPDG